ncbi:MAG: Asp-tRNA(Asn)/Glu-tRNA(Gln) amidotransferase subunit GatA, partial [Planctomycetota bacterium]
MNRPDATAIAAAIRSGALRAVDHARATLDAIDAGNPGLNAYHEVFHDAALGRAAMVDAQVAAGRDPGPLAGVCVAVKDNIATTIGRTTCSSRMLGGYRSPFDATVVTRLLAAGAVIVGKTNMDEFAMGSSSETCAWGVVRNPHDPTRTPGGSSGGSAAAMAAGLCDLSLGSDT